MDRREFVLGMGAGALTSIVGPGLAFAQGHKHEARKAADKKTMSKELKEVLETALDCLKTGNICVSHCNDNLAVGDTEMADCQKHVLNMLAVCDALVKTAAYNSAEAKNLKSIARTCADFCRSCEKACEKHAQHHVECKNCMQSCKDCAKACDAFAKA